MKGNKCPHCLESFYGEWEEFNFGRDIETSFRVIYYKCPSCEKLILIFHRLNTKTNKWEFSSLVRPKGISRQPIPPEVPENLVQDYKEACLVLSDSPKASAALSRRCLQHLLKEFAKAKKKDLAKQIEQVVKSKQLPSYLSSNLDTVRNIGNFAAHPIKSKNTGEIVEVEPEEAEWNLEVLEGLFDFYFVEKNKNEIRKDNLNKKLNDAGKPLLPV